MKRSIEQVIGLEFIKHKHKILSHPAVFPCNKIELQHPIRLSNRQLKTCAQRHMKHTERISIVHLAYAIPKDAISPISSLRIASFPSLYPTFHRIFTMFPFPYSTP